MKKNIVKKVTLLSAVSAGIFVPTTLAVSCSFVKLKHVAIKNEATLEKALKDTLSDLQKNGYTDVSSVYSTDAMPLFPSFISETGSLISGKVFPKNFIYDASQISEPSITNVLLYNIPKTNSIITNDQRFININIKGSDNQNYCLVFVLVGSDVADQENVINEFLYSGASIERIYITKQISNDQLANAVSIALLNK